MNNKTEEIQNILNKETSYLIFRQSFSPFVSLLMFSPQVGYIGVT